jgi:nucleoside-diphosphate-sugar epimerase
VITDLVLSGLKGRVRCMTDGLEQRRFLYKSDCVAALMQLFDGSEQSAEIAAPEWVTIRSVAEEIAQQLRVETEFGHAKGSECLVDPQDSLADWRPRVSLSEGIANVISDATQYLSQDTAPLQS